MKDRLRLYLAAQVFVLISASLFSSIASAASVKLFYFENGHRGWKGGFTTLEQCEKAARSNRLAPNRYYCATTQDYELERRLGWRP